MRAKRAFRDRDDDQVAVLDALVDRGEEGMTVLELRAAVDADIEAIETALSALKRDGLIDLGRVEHGDQAGRPGRADAGRGAPRPVVPRVAAPAAPLLADRPVRTKRAFIPRRGQRPDMEEPGPGAGGTATGADAREALRAFHADHGASFEEEGGVEVVADYGRRERTHRAVRNGVGVTEVPRDVVVLEGSDRHEYLDNVVTNRVPAEEGEGCYALLCDPQGRIETDMYVYDAGERLLVFTPPGVAADVVEGWETFIQDVDIRVATDEFAVFGVHGPRATEKVASVLNNAAATDERLTFVRGSMDDAGVSVIRTDAPAGEVGYEVVCSVSDAPDVLDTLAHRGMNAVLFGRATWRALALEAGTPFFATELDGRIPNVAGVRNAVDFTKGCFVGQEVVSKVENRGQPSRRLVGLVVEGEATEDRLPAAGATVSSDGDDVGEVTRAAASPLRGAAIAFAYVEFGLDDGAELTVTVDGDPVQATVEPFPLHEGSERSARIPSYPE
jgi:aminomethyltransferase